MADLTSKAFTGKGTIFSIGTTGSSPVYTAVSELKTYNQTGGKNDIEDVTNSDSAGRFKEKLVTLADSGELSISGNYVSNDAGQTAFKAAFISGATLPFKIIFPLAPGQTTTGETWTFLGIVTENDVSLQYDKAVTFAAKLAITGPITVVAGT